MSRGYRIAIVVILVAGVVTAAILAVVRLTERPPAPGEYSVKDAEHVVGYTIRTPSYIPVGFKQTAPSVSVTPQIKEVDFEYDDASNLRSFRGVAVAQAPHGRLGTPLDAPHGHAVSINRARGVLADNGGGTWTVSWSEDGLDFEVVGMGIADAELLRVARSMRP